MVKTGFRFGEFVQFDSHDRGTALGLVLGQQFPDFFLDERNYVVLYRDIHGHMAKDSLVAESMMERFDGHVAQEDFDLTIFVRKLAEEALPEAERPDED